MTEHQTQLTISLPVDVVEMIRTKVRAGECASESEYFESLIGSSLFEPIDESDLDVWARTEGVARLERTRRDPSSGLTSDEVFASLGIEFVSAKRG